ncbi:MAG: hypothetical protein V1740_04565 [Candidatus Woesearchaeota archaeon]
MELEGIVIKATTLGSSRVTEFRLEGNETFFQTFVPIPLLRNNYVKGIAVGHESFDGMKVVSLDIYADKKAFENKEEPIHDYDSENG